MKVSEGERRELGEEIRSAVASEHGVDVHHLVSPVFLLWLLRLRLLPLLLMSESHDPPVSRKCGLSAHYLVR